MGGPEDPGILFYLYSSMKRIHGSSDGWKIVKIRHRFYFLYDWKIHGSFYVTEYRKKDPLIFQSWLNTYIWMTYLLFGLCSAQDAGKAPQVGDPDEALIPSPQVIYFFFHILL